MPEKKEEDKDTLKYLRNEKAKLRDEKAKLRDEKAKLRDDESFIFRQDAVKSNNGNIFLLFFLLCLLINFLMKMY